MAVLQVMAFCCFIEALEATCQFKNNLLPNYKYSVSYSAFCGFIFMVVLTSTVPSVCPYLCELGLIAFSFFALLLDEKLVARFITMCHARVSSCSLWLCARFVLASQPLFDHPGPSDLEMLCVSACVLVQSS